MPGEFILLQPGGANSGVFGAGFGAGLLQSGLFSRLEAVYGLSCGAYNSAFLVAEQSDTCWSIYTDDFVHDFILVNNIFQMILKGLRLTKEAKRNVIDLDYAQEVVKRRLNVDKIRDSKIPAYVGVWNLDKKQVDFIDLRNAPDMHKLLRASSCAVPYFWGHEEVNGQRYVDAYLHDPLGINLIQKRHPDKKIIIVFNTPSITRSFFGHNLKVLEGLLASAYSSSISSAEILRASIKFSQDLKMCLVSDRILIVNPPENLVGPLSTNRNKLLKLFEWG